MDDPLVRFAFRGCGEEKFGGSVLSYRAHQQQAFLLAGAIIKENLIGCHHPTAISL